MALPKAESWKVEQKRYLATRMQMELHIKFSKSRITIVASWYFVFDIRLIVKRYVT